MPPASKKPRAEEGSDAPAEASQSDEWVLPADHPAIDPTEASSNPYGASTVIDADVVDPGGEDYDAEVQRQQDEANAVDQKTPGSDPGPAVIDGPFGTTLDSSDDRLGKLRVEVRSNVTLGNEVLTPFRKVEVTDDAVTRACIAVGHLRLLDEDEELDADNPEHADYAPF